MTPEAIEAIRRGICPACSKEHHRRLISCNRCGETTCTKCWDGIGGKCVQCLIELGRQDKELDQA